MATVNIKFMSIEADRVVAKVGEVPVSEPARAHKLAARWESGET